MSTNTRSRTRTRTAGVARRFRPAIAQSLATEWARLHRGDQEPFPDTARVERQAAAARELMCLADEHGGTDQVATTLQQAWMAFHSGRFNDAIRFGSALGAFGASVANKSAAVYSLHARLAESKIVRLLEQAAERGESAVRLLAQDANVHYTLALVLGRYSQRISILRALAQGLAERVRAHLQRALELEPRHAEAHIALGLFNAEIVGKLGSAAAGIAYHASAANAVQHFERAIELTPDSPIALMEYAHGLLLLNAGAQRTKVLDLYRRAAACQPTDAMERLDRQRAQREIAAL
jgi:tetratricopeptide (TPR) repeat protein